MGALRPVVRVIVPGAPDVGIVPVPVTPGDDSVITLPPTALGSKEKPLDPFKNTNAVALLLGDPQNPQWVPGDHQVTNCQTRKVESGTQVTIFNADASTPSAVVGGYDQWMVGQTRSLQLRIAVGTDLRDPNYNPEQVVLLETWWKVAQAGTTPAPVPPPVPVPDPPPPPTPLPEPPAAGSCKDELLITRAKLVTQIDQLRALIADIDSFLAEG